MDAEAYVRRCGYTIVPGREEKAVGLCMRLVDALRGRGVRAWVLVGGKGDATLQLVEEYPSVEDMRAMRVTLERDEMYRRAVCAWAIEFYPLVRASAPAAPQRDRQAA